MLPNKRVPSYRLHKASGQARVILDGRHVYLGEFGSDESREAYARIIAERFGPSVSRQSEGRGHQPLTDLSINEILVQYLEFAQRYYVKNGQQTKEFTCMKEAIGHLRATFGTLPAHEFGPLKLKAVRQHMIDGDLARGVVNNRTNRIKRVIRWAVSEELLSSSVYEGLRTVAGLRFGRSEARETEPIRPIANIWVDAILPFVSPQIGAMIELQRCTGMRPSEVVSMRPCDIDTGGDVWTYEPAEHKNRWRGHSRLVPLGPKAKSIIEPYLQRPANSFLFSPAEAEAHRNEQRAVRRDPNRKTKIYPSELKARARRRALAKGRVSKRPKQARYTTDSFRRAIKYAIAKANRERQKLDPETVVIPEWHPNQLRHSYATDVRKQFGVEAAQIGLGHARTNVVEVRTIARHNAFIVDAHRVALVFTRRRGIEHLPDDLRP